MRTPPRGARGPGGRPVPPSGVQAPEEKVRVRCTGCGKKGKVLCERAAQAMPCPDCGEPMEQVDASSAQAKPLPPGEMEAELERRRVPQPDAGAATDERRTTNRRRRDGAGSKERAEASPLVIAGVVGGGVVLLAIVAVGVALGTSRSAPPPTVAVTQPTPAGPSEPRFAEGPPRLPADLRAARQLVEEYEKERPDDLAGQITLYEAFLARLGPEHESAGAIERHLDELQERRARDVGARYDPFKERAQACLEEEDHAGALKVWAEARAALPPEVHGAIDDDVARIERRAALARGVRAVLEALPPPTPELPDAALLTRLGEALQTAADIAETPVGRQLVERARSERQKLRDERKRRGQARLQAIRDALEARTAARAQGLREREALARSRSRERPVRHDGKPHEVGSLTDTQLTLSGAGGDVTLLLGARPEVTAQALELGCRPEQGADLRELVVFCLEHRLFDAATRAAGRLAKLDAALARTLPDIGALRRAGRPFRGDELEGLPGGIEGGAYAFTGPDAAALLGDFAPSPGEECRLQAHATGLRVTGKRGVAAEFKEVAVHDHLTVEVEWPRAVLCDGLLELQLDVTGKEGTRLGVYLRSGEQRAAKLLRADGDEPLKEVAGWIEGGSSAKVTLGGGKLVVESGGLRAEAAAPTFARVRVLLSGVPRASDVDIVWPRFVITGRLRSEWRSRTLAAYDAVLCRELPESPLEAEVVAPPVGPGVPPPLPSADDAFALAGMGTDQLAAYRAAWTTMKAKVPAPAAVAVAAKTFDAVARARGVHAGAYYGRALTRLAVKDRRGARGDLDLAVLHDPGFPEAHAARGELRLSFGDYRGAEQDLQVAVEAAPDLAPVWRRLGQLAIAQEELPKALDLLTTAQALDPKDEEARRYFRSVRQVLAGPGWERVFTHETPHFLVSTNTSAARAREVGELLEQAREAYAALIGRPTAAYARERRASCLVFDTAESFDAYAELIGIQDLSGISLGGLYSSLYKQLLFYETRDDVTGEARNEVLFHEGFHRYADEVMPGCPVWSSEGLAEVVAGELTHASGLLEGSLSTLEDAIAARRVPPLGALLQMHRERFYRQDPGVNYAAAWAFCRFLVRGPAPEPAKRAFVAFLDALRERVAPEKAFATAFEGVDLPGLERDWLRWVGTLRR